MCVLRVCCHSAIRASSRPVPSSTTDLTATHVAVSVLSRRNGAVSADDDELIGSVLIPLADLHAQLPVVAWYPLHARPAKAEAQRVGSPKSGGIKSRQVGLVQLALHWVHALGELAHALQKRSIADLQSLFSAVDVSQLFLRVHSADLSAAWPSHADVAEHAAWLAPAVTLQFQGHTLRTEEGQAAANSGADPATMSRTHPCFDGRTYSFDVDSGGDLVLQLSVRRSLRASSAASEQLLAVARCSVAAFADQRTRSLLVTLQHPFTGDSVGNLHLSLLWLHNLPSALVALQEQARGQQA